MKENIESNHILDKLPKHLYQYVHPQNYDRYTPIDQAVWRYVMRRNVDYLEKVAHASYLEGLKRTGISTETIPSMYGMNRILEDIGWAAVAVDGFIPPAAFMEFQAYNVLVIASDIRKLDHIEYTPAPDIIHESAGHAPIIAIEEYSEYLRRLGEIGSKAISSANDFKLYEAVRLLSQLKEDRTASQESITKAQGLVDQIQSNMGPPSEMAQIRNLQWWSVEYGLIGSMDDPKIYGAGLLSSIGESMWCMSEDVPKHPYTVDAAYQSFDITKPQVQLFVTPDFPHLSYVLEQYADTMGLRSGGAKGVQKLIDSEQLGTIELSTGLQISGHFSKVITTKEGKVSFVQTEGPTALSNRNKELIGHGTLRHTTGFGTPVGKLKGINLAIEDMSPRDLEAYDIYEGKRVQLEFEGDILIEGQVVTGTRNLQGKILLIAFKECTVRHGRDLIFTPDRGLYHIGIGKEVLSAYAGPADLDSFDLIEHELSSHDEKQNKSASDERLEELYLTIKDIRTGKLEKSKLSELHKEITLNHSDEWLLLLELYEIIKDGSQDTSTDVLQKLEVLAGTEDAKSVLIEKGLKIIRA